MLYPFLTVMHKRILSLLSPINFEIFPSRDNLNLPPSLLCRYFFFSFFFYQIAFFLFSFQDLNKAQIQALINILKEQKVKLLQLKEQLLQVDAFLDSLQGIIPPWLYALLKQIIAQLLERIETLCKKIEALLARLDCLFKKACLKEKIAEITKKYISLQKELGDLKKECDAASKFILFYLISFCPYLNRRNFCETKINFRKWINVSKSLPK